MIKLIKKLKFEFSYSNFDDNFYNIQTANENDYDNYLTNNYK